MADIKYLDYAGLKQYDGLIKKYIDEADAAVDAKSFKAVSIDGKVLKFFRADPITEELTPAYQVTLPETDLSAVMKLVDSATAGNIATLDAQGQVVDSGKKVADFATAEQGKKADTAVQNIATGATSGTISVDGSDVKVKNLGTAAYKDVEAFDTKGAADAVLGTDLDDKDANTVHGAKAAAKAAQTTANTAKAGVDEVNGKIGTVEEGKTVVEMISDAQKAATYNDTAVKASIAENKTAINEEVKRAKAAEGDLSTLTTNAKTDLVGAINEVRASVSAGGVDAAITIDTTKTTDGYLKSYTIKQGENTVGVIDIPKDLVVQEGSVVTDPKGMEKGTYIKLVIANSTKPLYINVGSLVDIYKAKAGATQVQVTVDNSTREISAAIIEGSVGTTELADDAVTTAKIADANVTLAKLEGNVRSSLTKADSAVQEIKTGTENGTIAVDGTNISVSGLGSAAYTESTAYDKAGAADKVLGTDEDTADKITVHGVKKAAAAAKTAADGAKKAADNAQKDVDALETYVGTFTPVGEETTIVEYIDAKADAAKEAAKYNDTAIKADIKKNTDAITAINNPTTGILKQAKDYADGKDTETLTAAKSYTDTLANGAVKTNTTAISGLNTQLATAEKNITSNSEAISALRESVGAITAITKEDIDALFTAEI